MSDIHQPPAFDPRRERPRTREEIANQLREQMSASGCGPLTQEQYLELAGAVSDAARKLRED